MHGAEEAGIKEPAPAKRKPLYNLKASKKPIEFVYTNSIEMESLLRIAGYVAAGAAVLVLGNILLQLLPRSKSEPPRVMHWIPIVGNAVQYGTSPTKFFAECRKTVPLLFSRLLRCVGHSADFYSTATSSPLPSLASKSPATSPSTATNSSSTASTPTSTPRTSTSPSRNPYSAPTSSTTARATSSPSKRNSSSLASRAPRSSRTSP